VRNIFIKNIIFFGYVLGLFARKSWFNYKVKMVILYVRSGYFRALFGSLGQDALIAGDVNFENPKGIFIGDGVRINSYCHFWGGGGVFIGNNCMFASHCAIVSQTHDVNAEVFSHSLIVESIHIGNNVWVGTGVIILPGVTIGDNVVIGANSVVTRNIPSNSIAYGSPALVQKQR